MDKNGKLFGKLSIIDLLVLVVLVGAIIGGVYRFTSSAASVGTDGDLLNYTLKINGVRDFTFDYYEEGLPCYDKKTSQYIGSIKSVRQEPFYEETELADGTIIKAEQPGIIVVYVDLETEYTESESAYYAGGTYEIKAGSKVNLNFKYVDVEATVYNINNK